MFRKRIEWADSYMLKCTQNEKVQCFPPTPSPLNTSFSFSFAPFALWRVQRKLICQEVESWRQAQWWWALQGPCDAWLGSSLSYAGNMAGSGRFVLVSRTDGICAAQRRWWGLRWCSVISAEGSSTSSPGRAQHPDREGERHYGTSHVNKELRWHSALT